MNFIGNRNFRAGPQTSLEGFICPQNSDKQQKIKVFGRSVGGVKCGKSFVGQQVIFDSEHPENIEIGNYCAITMRCILLTHYVVPRGSYHDYEYGKIKIGNNVFLGANTIITKSVTIGDNVIVGAGSIVTKDIPSNEIWAGVPARFIKKYN